mmetsp:Transcript_77976/g.216618  ORF Transcript_77976/g.216618 Transcript_77976/m.216618 type:complete len:201 (+) Transcript_77976:1057-1659(+)
MVGGRGHRMYDLAVRQVRRVQPAHPHVVQHVQRALRFLRLRTRLYHDREKDLVGLDQLPRPDGVELLPRFRELPSVHEPIDEHRVHDNVWLETLVLHFPEQREARGQVVGPHVRLDERRVHLWRRADELLAHLQEQAPREDGVLPPCSTHEEGHEGTVVGFEAMKLHRIVRLHRRVHAALDSLRADERVAVLHGGTALQH